MPSKYMAEYMLKRYHVKRNQAIQALGGKCIRCGSEENLEFDHIEPHLKRFTIGVGWSRSEETLQEELRKCQLLCRDCHRDRTKQQQSVPHGGGVSGRRNCRCELCGPLKRKYMRDWLKKNKPSAPDGRAPDF